MYCFPLAGACQEVQLLPYLHWYLKLSGNIQAGACQLKNRITCLQLAIKEKKCAISDKERNNSKSSCYTNVVGQLLMTRNGESHQKALGSRSSSLLVLDIGQSKSTNCMSWQLPSLAMGIALPGVFEFVFAGSHIYSWETTGGCCDNFTGKL